MIKKKYVLITPARNEAGFIENTINSVISQTIKPQKWVIVSDGSTDGTDEIVKNYVLKSDFITLLSLDSSKNRDFKSKVNAISAGFEKLGDAKYDYIGNLDADISFKPDYYDKMIKNFELEKRLGLGGGKICDIIEGEPTENYSKFECVGGQIQLFRRKCFEDIGGYLPLKMGGEDFVAEAMARMKGWKVETFSDITVYHHRLTGTAQVSVMASRFRFGMQEYLYGSHPLFQMVKSFYRLGENPYVIGGLLRALGYLWAFFIEKRQYIPDEVVQYIRKEQMHKLVTIFRIGDK